MLLPDLLQQVFRGNAIELRQGQRIGSYCLTEQRNDEIPDLRQIDADDDAGNGGQQFGQTVDFHISYLVFLGLPFTGAVFFLTVGLAGALATDFLAAGFPLAGALGGGAV